jgi:hypothetical protein
MSSRGLPPASPCGGSWLSPEAVAKLECNRSLEDAVQKHVGRSADTARVGACATASQRVFVAFGGPQGHGDSVEDAVSVAHA